MSGVPSKPEAAASKGAKPAADKAVSPKKSVAKSVSGDVAGSKSGTVKSAVVKPATKSASKGEQAKPDVSTAKKPVRAVTTNPAQKEVDKTTPSTTKAAPREVAKDAPVRSRSAKEIHSSSASMPLGQAAELLKGINVTINIGSKETEAPKSKLVGKNEASSKGSSSKTVPKKIATAPANVDIVKAPIAPQHARETVMQHSREHASKSAAKTAAAAGVPASAAAGYYAYEQQEWTESVHWQDHKSARNADSGDDDASDVPVAEYTDQHHSDEYNHGHDNRGEEPTRVEHRPDVTDEDDEGIEDLAAGHCDAEYEQESHSHAGEDDGDGEDDDETQYRDDAADTGPDGELEIDQEALVETLEHGGESDAEVDEDHDPAPIEESDDGVPDHRGDSDGDDDVGEDEDGDTYGSEAEETDHHKVQHVHGGEDHGEDEEVDDDDDDEDDDD